jgi:hypothetical protein
MTIIHGFTSFNTIAPAPRIAPSVTVTPGPTKASAQMHASVPIALRACRAAQSMRRAIQRMVLELEGRNKEAAALR